MNVLVTGALGNIGTSAVDELLHHGSRVRCFDLPNRSNRRAARRLKGKVEVMWGDLRSFRAMAAAVRGCDVVVHLAFVIPKLSATGIESEQEPEIARDINVGGTQNLIAAIRSQPRPPKLIFSSSVHVYGPTQRLRPPRRATDPVHPVEHYSRHKVACERMVMGSDLTWAILRFAAALPFSVRPDPYMFAVPLDTRMEFVHTKDVGLAVAHAVSSEHIWGKTLHIGGGPRCQYYYREIAQTVLTATGVGMLPDEAFGNAPFSTDWLDTSVSQRLLSYQRFDLEDFTEELKTHLSYRRLLVRTFRPVVRRWLLRQSPFYKNQSSRRRRARWTITSDRLARSLPRTRELLPRLLGLHRPRPVN